MNILIFVKSKSKLHFFGPLSCYVRTLIINISSSKVPTNKVHIHSVSNVCKLVIIFYLSWQDLSRNVDHPFKNPTQRVRVQTNGAELKYSIHLAHALTKCPYASSIYILEIILGRVYDVISHLICMFYTFLNLKRYYDQKISSFFLQILKGCSLIT